MGRAKKNVTSDLNNEKTKVLHPNSDNLQIKLKYLFDGICRSPIYNLSMADKELFHSNMLAWIFEEYPIVVKELFQLQEVVNEDLKVDRECKHFDLLITYNGGKNIIIENKVKSIPYKSQLEKYTETAIKDANLNKPETKFFLLSLIKPSWMNNKDEFEVKDHIWKYISFEDVVQSISKTDKFHSDYHRELIDDYKRYCTFLSESIHILKNNNEIYFIPEIKDKRFYSMIIKWHYNIMSNHISQKLDVDNKILKDTIVNSGEKGKIKIGSSIAPKSKKGILEFHYVIDVGTPVEIDNKPKSSILIFVIQIEEDELRICFYINEPKLSRFGEYQNNKFIYTEPNLNNFIKNVDSEMWLDFIDKSKYETIMKTCVNEMKLSGLINKSQDRTIGQPKSYSGIFYYKNFTLKTDVSQKSVFQFVEILLQSLDDILKYPSEKVKSFLSYNLK